MRTWHALTAPANAQVLSRAVWGYAKLGVSIPQLLPKAVEAACAQPERPQEGSVPQVRRPGTCSCMAAHEVSAWLPAGAAHQQVASDVLGCHCVSSSALPRQQQAVACETCP